MTTNFRARNFQCCRFQATILWEVQTNFDIRYADFSALQYGKNISKKKASVRVEKALAIPKKIRISDDFSVWTKDVERFSLLKYEYEAKRKWEQESA